LSELRIDKWLWHARFCKTRGIAQQKAERGRIRLNGHVVEKASTSVRIGDTMTLTHLSKVIVIKVLGLGVRRGPAAEAMALYEVLDEVLEDDASDG
jgi:ribosome-associated heat shock protein Hsp15